jgi:hypothetical protein
MNSVHNSPKPVYIKAEQGQMTLVPGTIVTGIPYYEADTPCMYVGFRKGKLTPNSAAATISRLSFVSTTKLLPILEKWKYPVPNPDNPRFPFTLTETRYYLLPDLPHERFAYLNESTLVDATPLAQRRDLF